MKKYNISENLTKILRKKGLSKKHFAFYMRCSESRIKIGVMVKLK